MKMFCVLLVMIVFSYCAYVYKNKFKIKTKILSELIEYIEYYNINISFYKDDIKKINSDYNITQNNKNAKNTVFIQNNNIKQLNNVVLLKYFNNNEISIISQYFSVMGLYNVDIEKEKSNTVIKYLSELKNKTQEDLKTKGEMWFRIILIIGVMISIIMW